LAERHGKPVDTHLHDPGELGLFQIEEIARRTLALGMEGRVTISHAYALGMIGEPELQRTADLLARAGVSVMTNAPGDWPFPPVLPLLQAGVTIFGGTDNFRDSWWPYGDGDMIERAHMIGYRSGLYTDEELAVALDLVTHGGARALGLEGYGLSPGCRADLIAVDAEHVPETIVARPPRQLVVSNGRVVARNGGLVD
jgi:cytosine deaminase